MFEREQVFGRDASSVFPTEGQKAAAEAAEKLKSKLGANRFISETEVRSVYRAKQVRWYQKVSSHAALTLIAVLPVIRLFVAQIQELQKDYGGSTEGSEPIKPLAHILLEAKQAKDEAFQNQWKQMKQGITSS